MTDSWKPSKIEHDVIVVAKEREAKAKRGLRESEILRYGLRAFPDLYDKTEIKDALTVLIGRRYLKKEVVV